MSLVAVRFRSVTYTGIAQLVERLVVTQDVECSNHSTGVSNDRNPDSQYRIAGNGNFTAVITYIKSEGV